MKKIDKSVAFVLPVGATETFTVGQVNGRCIISISTAKQREVRATLEPSQLHALIDALIAIENAIATEG
jgi:hypothetical protein